MWNKGVIIRLSHNSTFSSAKMVGRIIRNEPASVWRVRHTRTCTQITDAVGFSEWTKASNLWNQHPPRKQVAPAFVLDSTRKLSAVDPPPIHVYTHTHIHIKFRALPRTSTRSDLVGSLILNCVPEQSETTSRLTAVRFLLCRFPTPRLLLLLVFCACVVLQADAQRWRGWWGRGGGGSRCVRSRGYLWNSKRGSADRRRRDFPGTAW